MRQLGEMMGDIPGGFGRAERSMRDATDALNGTSPAARCARRWTRCSSCAKGNEFSINGLASHNIYFEVLGEQGWSGSASTCRSSLSSSQHDEGSVQGGSPRGSCLDESARLGADAINVDLHDGRGFVAVAHQPLHYYLIMFAVCLSAVMARAATVPAGLAASTPAATPTHSPARRVRARRAQQDARCPCGRKDRADASCAS